MSNTKISADPDASALDGTEQLAGVQGGANVNITPAQIVTYANDSANPKTALVNFTGWNMDTTQDFDVAHGLGASRLNIVGVHAVIRSSAGVQPIPLNSTNGTIINGGVGNIGVTNITLRRIATGNFDSAIYNNAEGTILIFYTV
jgi:hypothetical protein